MTVVWLVTVMDYEAAAIISAHSTIEAAEAAAGRVHLPAFGRFGPFVVAVDVDAAEPVPIWPDGEVFNG